MRSTTLCLRRPNPVSTLSGACARASDRIISHDRAAGRKKKHLCMYICILVAHAKTRDYNFSSLRAAAARQPPIVVQHTSSRQTASVALSHISCDFIGRHRLVRIISHSHSLYLCLAAHKLWACASRLECKRVHHKCPDRVIKQFFLYASCSRANETHARARLLEP